MARLLSFTISTFWLCLVFSSSAVAAQKPTNQDIAESIADALRQAQLQGTDIQIEYNRGNARLDGKVANLSQKILASNVAAKVEGVEYVENFLKVQSEDTRNEASNGKMVSSSTKDEHLPVLVSRSVVISKQPEVMKMSLDVVSGGMKIEEALQQHSILKTHLRTKFQELGADPASIQFSDIKSFNMSQEEWWTYNKRRLMWISSDKRIPTAEEKPTAIPVIVSSVLTAEWRLEPLKNSEPLGHVVSLQEKIHASLSKVKSEGLLLDDSQQEFAEAFGITFPSLEAPMFAFAASINHDEKRQAMEEAIEEARSEADLMAAAAKVKLGKLLSIRKKEASIITEPDSMFILGPKYSPAGYTLFSQLESEEDLSLSEVIGVNAQKAQLKITVTLGFDLEKSESNSEKQ